MIGHHHKCPLHGNFFEVVFFGCKTYVEALQKGINKGGATQRMQVYKKLIDFFWYSDNQKATG
jgi:hypothetical protein